MLNIYNLKVSFGGEDLFSGVSFRLNAGDRVGLIGKNGAGKSTMLKVLSGDILPDSGEVSKDKGVQIGFLRQDIDFEHGRTVLEETYQAFEDIRKTEQRLAAINHELTERSDYESQPYHDLLHELSDLTERFELIGGYNYQGSTEKVLFGLGFLRSDFGKPTDTFSGGWRMRIELAKLLLQNNHVLLLDEPTNHLDIESIIWLEQFLKTYPGAVVIVSHDKMFLDNVTNRTIEISLGKIYDFNKPYSKYLALREDIRANQLAQQKNQEKQIKQTEMLIDRFRSKASKASMAQSLIKRLEKTELIEVDAVDNAQMTVSFPVSQQPGKVVVETLHVSKSYEDKAVLSEVNILIERGRKVAFVGQNGQGKTTLAKIIVGELEHRGRVKLGHNAKLGYFAQNQAERLNPNQTLLQSAEESADDNTRKKVRDVLGAFLFRGDDVFKRVEVLSGGERNRLALAKMLLQPFNFLVMDEPTNHLDIQSKNVLKTALQKFQGTLIIVSHDREFLQDLADIVFEFKDGLVKEFPGNINYYLEQRSLENLRDLERKRADANPQTKNEATKDAERKSTKPLVNKIRRIEAKISDTEAELKQIETLIATGDHHLSLNYQQKQKELEQLMEEWERLSQEHEKTK